MYIFHIYTCFVYTCTDISSSNVQNFIQECITTSKLDHPNVLGLIGVSINPFDATLHMIMSFMDHGDIRSFLKAKRGNLIEFDHFFEVHTYIKMYIRTYILCIANHSRWKSFAVAKSSYDSLEIICG